MKKINNIYLLKFIIFISFFICVMYYHWQYMDSSLLFPDELCNEVKEVAYWDADERVIVTRSEKEIALFFDILRNCKYQKIRQDKWVEGFVDYEIILENGEVSIGISDYYLAINGMQYKTKNKLYTDLCEKFETIENRIGG